MKLTDVDIVSQVCVQCTQTSRLERPGFPKIVTALLNKSIVSENIEVNDCTICSKASIDCVLKPCNHAVMCQDCAGQRAGGNCPVCHLTVNSYKIGELTSTSVGSDGASSKN